MIQYVVDDLRNQIPATAFFGLYAWHHWAMVNLEDFTCSRCGHWEVLVPPIPLLCLPTGIEQDRGVLYWTRNSITCVACGMASSPQLLYLHAHNWVNPHYAKSLEGGRG